MKKRGSDGQHKNEMRLLQIVVMKSHKQQQNLKISWKTKIMFHVYNLKLHAAHQKFWGEPT